MTAKVVSIAVSPINPCVGDKTFVRVMFRLNDKSLTRIQDSTSRISVPLPAQDNVVTTILDAYIEVARECVTIPAKTGFSNYPTDDNVLVVCFIPWQTGAVRLPQFDVGKAFQAIKSNAAPVILDGLEVNVSSVFANGVAGEELRPPLGPLLSPVTAHALYAAIAVAVALAAMLCTAYAKRESIRTWLSLRAMERKEHRNKKALRRGLADLVKRNASGKDFCTQLQRIVRAYISGRFAEDFAAFTTREIENACTAITAGMASQDKEEAYTALIAVLQRTDFVRFSPANKHETSAFQAHEKRRLVKDVLDAVDVLERHTN